MPITRKILLDWADRMQRMPVQGDADMDRIGRRLARLGVDVLDLSVIRSWLAPPPALTPEPADDSWRHANEDETRSARETIAEWYAARFDVSLNPETEICLAPSLQTAALVLSLAFIDVGDVALIPDPGLSLYRGAAALAGGGVVPYHLYERNDFLPNFEGLQEGLVGRSRLIYLSYPHNPTAAMADISILTQSVVFARRNNMLVLFDSTLALPAVGPVRPRCFLEAAGARHVGVEIFAPGILAGDTSLCPVVIAGNREAINAARFLLGAFEIGQTSGSLRFLERLLRHGPEIQTLRLSSVEESRRVLVDAFTQIGGVPRSAPTVPFLWNAVPSSVGAEGYCRRLLRRTGVRLTPGTAFGERGEGFVRAVIPDDPAVAKEVAGRLARHARLSQRRLPRPRPLRRRRDAGRQPSE